MTTDVKTRAKLKESLSGIIGYDFDKMIDISLELSQKKGYGINLFVDSFIRSNNMGLN